MQAASVPQILRQPDELARLELVVRNLEHVALPTPTHRTIYLLAMRGRWGEAHPVDFGALTGVARPAVGAETLMRNHRWRTIESPPDGATRRHGLVRVRHPGHPYLLRRTTAAMERHDEHEHRQPVDCRAHERHGHTFSMRTAHFL